MICTRQGMMARRGTVDDKNNNSTRLFYGLSVNKLKRFLLNLRYKIRFKHFIVRR